MGGSAGEMVVATRNRKKIAEIARMLAGSGLSALSLDQVPGCPEVVEDAPDFEGNALKKAREICAFSGRPALADDSGLVVDALGGAPGVYSARYAGEDATDMDNNRKLLKGLEGVPPEKRTARFVCVMAYVTPGGEERTFTGDCEGSIGFANRGESGFGYDPLFVPDGHKKTFAEMTGDEKDSMSHRGRALRAFAKFVRAGK
jgi:XTP/dITP diphosphohydrolase